MQTLQSLNPEALQGFVTEIEKSKSKAPLQPSPKPQAEAEVKSTVENLSVVEESAVEGSEAVIVGGGQEVEAVDVVQGSVTKRAETIVSGEVEDFQTVVTGSVEVELGKNVEEKAVEGVVQECVEYTAGKVTEMVMSSQVSGEENVSVKDQDVVSENELRETREIEMEEQVEETVPAEELPLGEASRDEEVPVEESVGAIEADKKGANAEEPSMETDEEMQVEEAVPTEELPVEA